MATPRLGDLVKVRTATGEERRVRVAGFGDGVIYVTTEAEYQLSVTEGREPVPLMGFPVHDVIAA